MLYQYTSRYSRWCFFGGGGGGNPQPPPAPPPPPPPPTTSNAAAKPPTYNPMGSIAGSIFSSPQGVDNTAAVSRKTLLGQ